MIKRIITASAFALALVPLEAPINMADAQQRVSKLCTASWADGGKRKKVHSRSRCLNQAKVNGYVNNFHSQRRKCRAIGGEIREGSSTNDASVMRYKATRHTRPLQNAYWTCRARIKTCFRCGVPVS